MRKKAQEEIVGFVLIVVIVAVIAVIFLGISLRKSNTDSIEINEELNSFLSAVSYFTTDCEIPETKFQTIGDLVVKCYDNEQCANGELVCEVLEETLEEILESSTYVVGENSRTQYYKLEIYYDENVELISPVQEGVGDCSGARIYNEKEFRAADRQEIIMRFEVCQN